MMYYVRENKQNVIPTHIIFFDTEAYIKHTNNMEEHTFRLATYRYYRLVNDIYILKDERTVHTIKEFWDRIIQKVKGKTAVWLMAHNLHYDFFILDTITQLTKRGFKLEVFTFDNNLFYARFRSPKGGKIYVVDTMNYFKTSLEELGKKIGKQKLHVDFTNVSDDELEIYNRRDVEILAEFFIRFLYWWRNEDLGKFGISIPQCALRAFRHRFMKKKIVIHRDPRATQLEQKAYFGGRCECFYIGEVSGEKLYKLDVNSMYPYVMKHFKYPIKLRGIIENPTLKYLRKLIMQYCLICEVEVNTDENTYPYRANKLIFPLGQFTTYLSTPELIYALANNHVVKVSKCAVYDCDYIFADYVDYFYKLKQRAEAENDQLTRAFAKLMLNSLYGKFGQQTRNYEEIQYPATSEFGSEIYVDANTGKHFKILFINGKAYKRADEAKLSAYTFIAIAAHVTAYARTYLWQLMKTAGLENVYYVDTDSLFVNEQGYINLQQYIGSELGKLKIESTANKAIFLAPKVYVFEDERKFKGLTKNAKQISENEYEDVRFWRALTLLSKGIHDKVIVEKITKNFSLQYDKGIVQPNGHVKPFTIPHDLDTMRKLKLTN